MTSIHLRDKKHTVFAPFTKFLVPLLQTYFYQKNFTLMEVTKWYIVRGKVTVFLYMLRDIVAQ